MDKKINNCAFIDSNNLYLGIRQLGWSLDYKRFRVYLEDKYKVGRAYLFIGYVSENQDLYSSLQKYGYILVFKPTFPDANGDVKGNVDADLVLQTMVDLKDYDRAVLVTGDGDFYCLAKYLARVGKLRVVLSPSVKSCSSLLKKTAGDKLVYMDTLRKKLGYHKKKKSRPRTKP